MCCKVFVPLLQECFPHCWGGCSQNQGLRICTCLLPISLCSHSAQSVTPPCPSCSWKIQICSLSPSPLLSAQLCVMCTRLVLINHGRLDVYIENLNKIDIKEQCDGVKRWPGGGMVLVTHLVCAGVCGWGHGHVWEAKNRMFSAAVTQGIAGLYLFGLLVSTQDSLAQASTSGHGQKVRGWEEVRI